MPSTITLEDRIIAVLSDFIKAGTPFTILDISNAVKQDGNGFARHRDVRPIVADMIENETVFGVEDYIVTQIQVSTPKGLDYANLYHLEDDDPDDYTNRQQKALSPSELGNVAPVAPAPQIVSAVDDDDEDDDDTTSNTIFTHSTPVTPTKTPSNMQTNARAFKLPKPRYDGAVEIPKKLLETAGLLNEEVEIIHHPNSIGIVPATATTRRSRVAHAGMRISKSALRKSNLAGRTDYEAAAFTEKIVIA